MEDTKAWAIVNAEGKIVANNSGPQVYWLKKTAVKHMKNYGAKGDRVTKVTITENP